MSGRTCSTVVGNETDLNYDDFLGESGPSTGQSIKAILDQAVWKYSSVFMAQPFEVAKMVLQCHMAKGTTGIPSTTSKDALKRHGSNYREEIHHDVSSVQRYLNHC